MPLDGPFTFLEPVAPALPEKPTLELLATILRDRSMWPKNFSWDYGCCSSCAMGLTSELFHIRLPPHRSGALSVMSEIFQLKDDDRDNIFYLLGKKKYPNYGDETDPRKVPIHPEEVADAIDHYLASQKPKQSRSSLIRRWLKND
jgi:hypothetical protein